MDIKQQKYHHGRLAAGGDKKNAFVSPLNIQNIPKPHVTNHYVIPEDICKKYYPEVIEVIDKSGTLEEGETDLRYIDQDKIKELCNKNGFDYNQVQQVGKRWSYRIFGYVVSEKPWLIPGVEEGVVEGFIQELNSRSCFLPDPGYYFVTCVDVDSKVKLENGKYVPIKLFENEEFKKNNRVQTLNTFTSVTHYTDKGYQKKCILKTESGKELNCTKDHKFYIIDDDTGELILKKFEELSKNDIIITIDGSNENE